MGLIDDLAATYPWIVEMGLLDLVTGLIQNEDATGPEILQGVYKSQQYQKMFPGMYDESGRRRYANEREYLDRVNDYRQVLREFGAYDASDDDPMDYTGFMAQGIDPSELQQRFKTYREVERGSQDLKDAYYVYAGMDVSTDDLYQALVDPNWAQQLESEYDKAVASNVFDYETFITRATERGLQRTAEQLRIMQSRGLVSGAVVSNLLAVDPNFARDVMGSLFTGGSIDANSKTLGLDELMVTFDYAMIGSAAREQGLEMPTKERIAQLRQAGVDRASALRSYGAFSQQKQALRAMAERANRGNLDQKVFEDAVFLSQADAVDTLNRAQGGERALGKNTGGFNTGQDGQRLTQRGRR